MAAAQKLLVAVSFVVCIFVSAAEEPDLAKIYRACFDPCISGCVNRGENIFFCEKSCDASCKTKAYDEVEGAARKKAGGWGGGWFPFKVPSQAEDDQFKDVKAKVFKDFMDKHCKTVTTKQCKDDDQQCKDEQTLCKNDEQKFVKDEA